jgi:ubiquinone/menaquinone biosynthesis C-methylase UbiE
MSSFDFRTLFAFPSQPETDIPASVLLGQMWWYATTMLYPAQALKLLGLYPANEIGRYPTSASATGEGPWYSRRYHEPVYLDAPSPYDDSVQYFDRVAAIYDSCIEPFTRPIYEEAIKLMHPLLTPNARILDTSCGPGTEMFRIVPLTPHGEVVGMDLSAGMVKTAFEKARRQGLHNTAFFQADVGAMPDHFSERFDATFCFGAFHHYPDPLAAVKEMRRVLNAHGKAFIVDPGPWWFKELSAPLARWGDPGWVNFCTGEEFQALFSRAGFADFYWTEVLPGFGMCIAGK